MFTNSNKQLYKRSIYSMKTAKNNSRILQKNIFQNNIKQYQLMLIPNYQKSMITRQPILIIMNQHTHKQHFTLGRNSQQIIRDGSFATRKEHLQNQLFTHHIADNNIRIQNMLKRLHAAYIHQKIPDFYGYFFLGQLTTASEDRIEDSLNREMQLLRTKQCHYNLIMRTLNARQSCIKSLHRCLDAIFQQNQQSLMSKFKHQIGNYRQLTALIIQQIKQWKEYLLQINPIPFGDQHIAFYYQNNDYLIKILNDVDFINQSFLSAKVTFSYKQDPFLLRPFTESQAEQNQSLQLFKFTSEQRQRFVDCLQFLAEQRADYVKRKLSVREGRIRDIQKAYQTKHIPNRILVTKPHNNLFKKGKQQALQTPIDFVDESRLAGSSKDKRSRSLNELKQSKMRDFLIKGEKIKKIRDMKLGEPMTLINSKKFVTLDPPAQKSNPMPMARSISLSFLKTTTAKKQRSDIQERPTDFESMLREKQLQVLQKDNKQRRTFSSVKLNDKLSERKVMIGQQGAEELQKILQQLEYSAPQDQGFIKRRANSGKMGKSLLQHNQEAILTLRKSVLKEIEDHQSIKHQLEQQKQDERLQMQKLIKEKLDKQSLLNIQKQKNKWIQGKDILAHELDSKQIFGYSTPSPQKSQKLTQLQEDLKKQMQMKWLRQVHQELSHRGAMNIMQKQKKKEQLQREKQFQVAKRKQEQEKRFNEIQNEERIKVTKEILDKERQKQRQIQEEMEEVVRKEKEKLQTFSYQQKNHLQHEMRQAVKVNLLKKLRRQKSQYTEAIKAEETRKLQEASHRAEVKRKIQQQFQIGKELQRQRQREQKNNKLKLVARKMQHIQQQIEKDKLQKQKSIIKPEELISLRSQITNIPDLRKSKVVPFRQQNKKKLRQNFELELFAFNRPEEQFTHQNNYIVKDFRSKIDNQQNLNAKINELKDQISKDKQDMEKQQAKQYASMSVKQQSLQVSIPPKGSSLLAQRQKESSEVSDKFVRFSEEKSRKSIQEEEKVPSISEMDLKKLGIDMSPLEYKMYIRKKAAIDTKKIGPQVNEEVQKRKVKSILEQFQIMEDIERQPYTKAQKKYLQIQDIEQEEQHKEKKQQIPKNNIEQKPLKSSNKKQKQESDDLQEIMKLTVHSKMSSIKKKRFVTSDESEDESPRRKHKKRKEKEIVEEKSSSPKKISLKSISPKKQNRQTARFQSVAEQELDNYLTQHFKNLTKLMRKINLFKKDELLKMIFQAKNLQIVEVVKGQQLEGIGFISQNENKQSIRSLNILHLGTYADENSINVLIKVRDLVFSIDPCAQITYSMYYEKQDALQFQFIKQFQKKFDPYGAIFQKKINNEQSQRKNVMRRMIGQESSNTLQEKSNGQIKIMQQFFVHSIQQNLGLNLGLQDIGTTLGGWTLFSLFLTKYGQQQQIQEYLDTDVNQKNKNIKYISKMSTKLKTNTVRDLEYFQFKNPFETNLKLIEQNVDILKCDPKIQESEIPIRWMKANMIIQPVLPFVSTTAKVRYQDDQVSLNYLRYKIGKGAKVVKLKSNRYSTTVTVIPCKPTNYKFLVTEAAQFDTLKGVSLDLYMKLFLANVDAHTLATDQHIWIPQFQSKQLKTIEMATNFGFNTQFRSKSTMTFTEYINNSIIYSPHHQDIIVTPPFIIAVLNSEVERLTEGSPMFIERIDMKNLMGVKAIPKPPVQSDF